MFFLFFLLRCPTYFASGRRPLKTSRVSKLPLVLNQELTLFFGSTANEMTASGTKIDSMERRGEFSDTNVSPEEQSTPNNAQISPADAVVISYERKKTCVQKVESLHCINHIEGWLQDCLHETINRNDTKHLTIISVS